MAIRIKKFFVGFLALLLILAALVLAVRAVWNYVEGRKLSAALEKAKASGVALQVKDLVPNCPETENAASLLKAAWELVPKDGLDRKAVADSIPALFDGYFPEGEPVALVTKFIEQNPQLINLMMEASNKNCLKFGDWSQPAYKAEIGQLVKSIWTMRLLAIDAAYRAENGDIERGLNQSLAGLRLSRLEFDEPILIKGLVAIAEMRICLTAARFILNNREIAPDILASWIKELDPLALRKRFALVIPAERAFSLEAGEGLLRGEAAELDFSHFWSWLVRPMIKAQIRQMPEFYEGLEKISLDPYYSQTTYLIDYDKRVQEIPEWKRFLRGVVSGYQAAFLKEATIEALMLTMRSGLACRLYELKNGSYPEKLEVLVPEFLSEVPLDPFTGKPLIYRLENGLPLIYSLGSNGKDDGGRSTFSIVELVAPRDDDWTWRERIVFSTSSKK